jgi:hypothetical protein
LSVDLAQASRPGYEMEVLYPNNGVLSRQDDRYHTLPYTVAFMRCLDASQPLDSRLAGSPFRPYNAWTRFDHPQRRTQSFVVGGDSGVQECCFVPRSAHAPEGDGYLIGVSIVRSNAAATWWSSMRSGSPKVRSRPCACRSRSSSRCTAAGYRPSSAPPAERHRRAAPDS